jgi:hypothetical protein
MRRIYVEDGLSVSFPWRDAEFDQGVEVGIAIALMAAGQNFTTWLSNDTIEQVKELAAKMNFHLISQQALEETTQVSLRVGSRPSHLTLVAEGHA